MKSEMTPYIHSDVIVGGPPCQGYSMAGRRNSNDPRNSLFMEFVAYLEFYQPSIFFMENVMGILSMKLGDQTTKSIDVIMEHLTKYYHCRIRVIFVGIHNKYNQTPPEFVPIIL